MKSIKSITVLLLLFISTTSLALQFPLPKQGNDLVGQLQFVQTQPGDTFAALAEKYDVGYYQLYAANPEVNPKELTPYTELIIPTQFILPHIKREGIVIDLGAMRLYYFPKNENVVYTYPVGIGQQDWNSPIGTLDIIQKEKNPVWVVPQSIYDFRKKNGDPVPHMLPSGPNNPLGFYALRLSLPTYLIHGTNDPASVGRRSSAGCIHLYANDIQELFNIVTLKTNVQFINQPYLIGLQDGDVYLEAHLPLKEQREALANRRVDVVGLVGSLNLPAIAKVDWQKADMVLKEHTGVPVLITTALEKSM